MFLNTMEFPAVDARVRRREMVKSVNLRRGGGHRGTGGTAAIFVEFQPQTSDRVRPLWQPSADLAGPHPATDPRFNDI
jgi:hypothetical protein